jgi:hypothetical protein
MGLVPQSETGEIVTVTDEDRHLVEDGDLDEDDLPEWQRESLPKVREALESGDFLALPDQFGIHEWAIMELLEQSGKRGSARRIARRDSRCGGIPKFSERYPAARHRRRLVSLSAIGV